MVAEKKRRIPRSRRLPGAMSIPLRADALALYVVDGYGPTEIAVRLNGKVTPRQVTQIAYAEGWADLRNAHQRDEDSQAKSEALARAQRHHEAVAAKTEALTFGVLDRCDERLKEGDDKGLSMVSTALRNIHEVSRKARGLDRPGVSEGAAGMTLNVFLARGQRVEKNITPGSDAVTLTA